MNSRNKREGKYAGCTHGFHFRNLKLLDYKVGGTKLFYTVTWQAEKVKARMRMESANV